MKRLLIISCLMAAAWPPPASAAAVAYFTGRMHQTQTPNHEVAWNCQYNHEGNTFWRIYIGNCPAQIEL